MADYEHYASPHESLVELLRCMPPRALVELICRAHGTLLGEITQINERTPTIEIPDLLRRARRAMLDLVLTVHTKGIRAILIVIVEGQLSWDDSKPGDWAMFSTAFAARSRGKAILAVFCPDPKLRAKFRVAVAETLPPPVLIEPAHVELITDDERARREPHQTILGAIYHAGENSPESARVAGIRAALIAVSTLEPSEQLRYYHLMKSLLTHELIERALAAAEPIAEQKKLDILQRYGEKYRRVVDDVWERGLIEGLSDGLAQGREEGKVQILRRVLIDILELRGFGPTADMTARIESCDDAVTLDRWYTRARTCDPSTPLDDLLV